MKMKKRRSLLSPPLLMYEFQDLEILLAGTAEAAASFTAGTAETAASFTAGASAETATSLAAGSVLTGTGFIHNKCTAALHCAVETFDRSVGLACFGHFDETETFGTAGLAISYKTDASHVSVSRESCFEFIC